MAEENLNWNAAARETRRQLADLPDYTTETILENYTALLDLLRTDEIKEMPPNARAFHCQQAFPKFAIGYSALFNIAVRRQKPVPLEAVRMMLLAAEKQKDGSITEEAAQQIAMNVAESCRKELTG